VKKETTGSFQALDPSSSEYKKQKKNRQTNERNYLAAIKRKRQAERRSAAYCDPFCFAHAAGVISAI